MFNRFLNRVRAWWLRRELMKVRRELVRLRFGNKRLLARKRMLERRLEELGG